MEDYKNSEAGKIVAQKYADILFAERPDSEESRRKFPRMPLEKRAKIFSPFAALRGYEDSIAEEEERMYLVPRQELPEEDAAQLNTRLGELKKGITVSVRYFQMAEGFDDCNPIGYYTTVEGIVEQIEPEYRRLRVGDTVISFTDLIELIF